MAPDFLSETWCICLMGKQWFCCWTGVEMLVKVVEAVQKRVLVYGGFYIKRLFLDCWDTLVGHCWRASLFLDLWLWCFNRKEGCFHIIQDRHVYHLSYPQLFLFLWFLLHFVLFQSTGSIVTCRAPLASKIFFRWPTGNSLRAHTSHPGI